MDFGDFPLTGQDLKVDGVPLGCGPRRKVLDKILVGAAVAAGAEVRERFVVEEFTTDSERITGLKGRDTRANTPHTEQARIVIGADGRNSRLARAVQAPEYESGSDYATRSHAESGDRVMPAKKSVLISGASSGIGQTTAQLLSQQGFTVFSTRLENIPSTTGCARFCQATSMKKGLEVTGSWTLKNNQTMDKETNLCMHA